MRWVREHKIAVILVVLALLIAVRAALPHGVQWYVNRTLDRHEAYDGRIGDVDLSLIRGLYTIQGLDIVRRTGDAPEPLFEARAIDLSVQWGALLDGAIVGEIDVFEPVVNFAVTEKGDVQTGEEADWREVVLDLFPVQINRLALHDGTVRYLDTYSEPRVDLTLSDLNAEARNLTNATGRAETLAADLELTALAMNSGRLELSGRADPYEDHPTFEVDVKLRDLAVAELNPWLEATAKFDVASGTLDLYTELRGADGSFEGYFKPLFHDLDVLSSDDLKDGGPLSVAWEAAVGLVKSVFTNPREKQLATVIPIRGRFDAPEIGVAKTIGEAVSNAFLKILQPGFEGEPVDGSVAIGETHREPTPAEKLENEAEAARREARAAFEEDLAKANEKAETNAEKGARKRADAKADLQEELSDIEEDLQDDKADLAE